MENTQMELIIIRLNDIQIDIASLLQAQNVSNFLSLANNPLIPEDIRQDALQKIMPMMGYNLSQAASQFEDLPKDVIR